MTRGLLISCVVSVSLWGAPASVEQAEQLYQRTDYEGSLRVLLDIPEKNASVYDLIGKNQFMLGDFKRASESYAMAVAADPNNAEYEHWLGKAFGKRAETGNPLAAPAMAAKARQHFERAVALDSGNKEAVNDLFEYYLEAPGFLGGGVDKAVRVAETIATLDRAEGFWAQARIAERRKDFVTAEERLRQAMKAAPTQVGRVIDLAKFLSKHGRIEESDQAFRAAERLAPDDPRLLYHRAEAYIKAGRNIEIARNLLKRYLSATLSPDDPSRLDAEKLLKQAGG